MKLIMILVSQLHVMLCLCHAQGFVNLGFEAANLAGIPSGFEVPATNAFPFWTVSARYVLYNNFSLSGGSISIMSTNSHFTYPPP